MSNRPGFFRKVTSIFSRPRKTKRQPLAPNRSQASTQVPSSQVLRPEIPNKSQLSTKENTPDSHSPNSAAESAQPIVEEWEDPAEFYASEEFRLLDEYYDEHPDQFELDYSRHLGRLRENSPPKEVTPPAPMPAPTSAPMPAAQSEKSNTLPGQAFVTPEMAPMLFPGIITSEIPPQTQHLATQQYAWIPFPLPTPEKKTEEKGLSPREESDDDTRLTRMYDAVELLRKERQLLAKERKVLLEQQDLLQKDVNQVLQYAESLCQPEASAHPPYGAHNTGRAAKCTSRRGFLSRLPCCQTHEEKGVQVNDVDVSSSVDLADMPMF